ncbi:HAD-IIB family hydrolase [Candidatus Saccharibacteria bacterium]|nr:HAD-IIB family hydrolase [Candidatus Saccharibacteria bacterium]
MEKDPVGRSEENYVDTENKEEQFETFEEHMAEMKQEEAVDRAEEDKQYFEVFDKFRFDGHVTFTDIDKTLTDNDGNFDPRAVEYIKKYREAGGVFVPVTGRARFESVKDIVEKLDLPFIIINNGAEIYDRNGNIIYKSEIPMEQVKQTFALAEEYGLIWMQNKKNPETGEEYLYSNYTETTEQEMNAVGIEDTPENEVKRIKLPLKKATSEEVMGINDSNLKIQMMSPDYKAVRAVYDKLQEQGIPCMLNMQSEQTKEFHWVEVIVGTKIGAIQWVIDHGLVGDIKTAQVVGDGGNDLSMFKELHNRDGEPIPNTYTAVANGCEEILEKAHKILQSKYDEGLRGLGKGGAMAEIFEDEVKMREIQAFTDILNQLLDKKMYDQKKVLDIVSRIKNKRVIDSRNMPNSENSVA